MMDGIKYLVFPGWAISKTDRQKHFISGRQLIMLYGVNPKECKIIHRSDDLLNIERSKYISLFPRHNGDYKL